MTVVDTGPVVPPGPVHVREYVVVEGGVTDWEPDVAAIEPAHDDVQDVAFATVHESVVESPAVMVDGAAPSETFGGTIECVQLSKRTPE